MALDRWHDINGIVIRLNLDKKNNKVRANKIVWELPRVTPCLVVLPTFLRVRSNG